MKLINADKFIWKLEDYAITDADREFCQKVKFALDKEPPAEAVPIEYLNTLAANRPGMISAAISLIKEKWREEREKDGQVKSEHNGSGQGAENVAADRPPFDGIGSAPDRGLRTAEGLQPDGVFCVSKTAGRRKSAPRDRIAEAVRKIDNLIDVAEPIEIIDDICRKTREITEFTGLIEENLVAQNFQTVKALTDACEIFADRSEQSAKSVGTIVRSLMKQVGEIRTALTMLAEKES